LRATEIGTGADRVLVAGNAISDARYVKTLALSLGTGYDSLLRIPRSACPGSDRELLQAIGTGVLWLATGRSRVLVIAPHDIAARQLVNILRLRPELCEEIWLTTPRHLADFVSKQTTTTLARDAISGLMSAQPEFSASPSCSRRTIVPMTGCAITTSAFVCAPASTMILVIAALALIFLGWTALRAMSILTAGFQWQQQRLIPDRELPVYSIIVALYREAATVGGLIESLQAIDYPPEKLDIILALEPDDRETWHALAKLQLGPAFTVVLAPAAGPRTKPKALNTALAFARGSYVAIFDAEDRPEPDQLKKALQAFRTSDRKLACVQARLTIDNSAETWFTGMFAAEYAGLFDVFLPGIAAWRLPLPLGGTSNHFRTSTLREAGAWDPYNVTEDADLGMRLARLGYHTGVINSTTYEEAPSRLMPWLKQRTRWFKGWMQTWLVHMRHPVRLWRDLRPSGFIAFQLVIGGSILTAIVHGVFVVALGWQIAMGWLWAEKSTAAEIVFAGLHVTTLLTGYAISGLLGMLGLARRRKTSCAWTLWLMPVYWLLLSVAAWRALFDLILEPYAWDKTEHTLARHVAP
jgi:cellulose synthase/poly-beta-1,6-N-acetylglucosamine synthase-like glycosyltransferase